MHNLVKIESSAILLCGALLLENDFLLRAGRGGVTTDANASSFDQERHAHILATAKCVAEHDPHANLLSIFVFLLGRQPQQSTSSPSSDNEKAFASALAEYKLSLLECLPAFGTHSIAVPLLRRLLSALLLRPTTCAVAIRIFTEIWRVRQNSGSRSGGSLFPVLERGGTWRRAGWP